MKNISWLRFLFANWKLGINIYAKVSLAMGPRVKRYANTNLVHGLLDWGSLEVVPAPGERNFRWIVEKNAAILIIRYPEIIPGDQNRQL